MSQRMKSPRDILVAGISFLLGMVFCYFLIAAKLSGQRTGATWAVMYGSTPAVTNAVDLERLKLNWN